MKPEFLEHYYPQRDWGEFLENGGGLLEIEDKLKRRFERIARTEFGQEVWVYGGDYANTISEAKLYANQVAEVVAILADRGRIVTITTTPAYDANAAVGMLLVVLDVGLT